MSQEAKKHLAPPTSDADSKDEKKRKMTSAIIEDETKKKDVYQFLEEDDDFEEFEDADADDMMVDSELQAEPDKKLW